MKRSIGIAVLTVLLATLPSCGRFGQVNEGQVVKYSRAGGIITLISDSNYRDPARPRFDALPPVTIRIPEDPREMGPEPDPGSLLALDSAGRRAVFFDPNANELRTVAIAILSEQTGVHPTDPRVSKTPVVDRAAGAVITYLPRERKLVRFSVADEYLACPAETWKVGDQIRYYYKEPGRALRLMNVTKTDLNKAGE